MCTKFMHCYRGCTTMLLVHVLACHHVRLAHLFTARAHTVIIGVTMQI